MAPMVERSHLSNPLASAEQLQTSASRLGGVPEDLVDSIHFEGARLIQAAGILLRLPQEIIAESIVIFSRFWIGPAGGSLLDFDAQDVVVASLYLVTKPSAHPISPRQIISAFRLLQSTKPRLNLAALEATGPGECFLSEGSYQDGRITLMRTEAQILRVLGYQTHVALPYSVCINYLQALNVLDGSPSGTATAKRAFAHINTTLLSPQLLVLTHQPCALATAAIYLAAKEVGVKLPAEEWWEVFDVDREELGFLVVALTSMHAFAEDEARKWSRRPVPMTKDEVETEIERRHLMVNGE